MIDDFYKAVTSGGLEAASFISTGTLKSVNSIVAGTLHLSGQSLDLMSKSLIFWEQGREALVAGTQTIHTAKENSERAMLEAIEKTTSNFAKAKDAIEASSKMIGETVFENRVISSILGGSMGDKIRMSRIQMSFRDNKSDIPVKQAVQNHIDSGLDSAILWIPGLLTDEGMWQNRKVKVKERSVLSHGLAERFERRGYFPYYLRYNNGKHIYKNGHDLLHILEQWDIEAPANLKLNLVTYSMGGLVVRSMLHYAKEKNSPILNRFAKVIFISAPNGGSYLEKAGFWLGTLLTVAPSNTAKLLGLIGNMRSDAIKDLSHGMIREEPWYKNHHIARYFTPRYYNELDDIDFYSVYSIIAKDDNPVQAWLGDGIVEEPSLRFLENTVKITGTSTVPRSFKIHGENHFSIMNSKVLFSHLSSILT